MVQAKNILHQILFWFQYVLKFAEINRMQGQFEILPTSKCLTHNLQILTNNQNAYMSNPSEPFCFFQNCNNFANPTSFGSRTDFGHNFIMIMFCFSREAHKKHG